MALSPQGMTLAIACGKQVRFLPLGAVTLAPKPITLPAEISALAWSPDGALLLTASDFEFATLTLHDVAGRHPPRTLSLDSPTTKAHPSAYLPASSVLAFSPDGKRVAAAGYTSVDVFDVQSGLRVGEFSTPEDMGPGTTALAFDQKGEKLHAFANDTLFTFDIARPSASSRKQLPVVLHDGSCPPILRPAQNRIFACAGGGALYLGQLQDPSSHTLRRGLPDVVYAVAVHPDQTVVIAGLANGQLWRADPRQGGLLPPVETKEPVRALAFSPDGAVLYASQGNDIAIRRSNHLELSGQLSGHEGPVRALAVDASGTHLLSGANDRTMRWWDLATGRTLTTLSGHEAEVTAVALASDHGLAASGSEDGTTRIWDPNKGDLRHILIPPEGKQPVTAVLLLAGGKRVVTATAFMGDTGLWSWDTGTGRLIASQSVGQLGALSLAPLNQQQFLAGGVDGKVTFHDAEKLQQTREFFAASGYAMAISSAPGGRTIALGSAGNEQALRIWTATQQN
jgi:WD40 repeat protein